MLYLIIASLIWSLSFGVIGNLLADVPPPWLALFRVGIAALLFLPFVRPLPGRAIVRLLATGMLQFGLMTLTYLWSFNYLKSHEIALFTVMTPLYVALASDASEGTLKWRNLLIAAVAVSGAALILWRGLTPGTSLKGFLLIELSNIFFALGQISYRETMRHVATELADHQVFFWLYLGALLIVLPLALTTNLDIWPIHSTTQWGALLYLGVAVAGISYFCWNRGVRRVKGIVLAVMNNLKIPLGMLASLLLFREKVNLSGLLAGSILLLAALLTALLAARDKPSATSAL